MHTVKFDANILISFFLLIQTNEGNCDGKYQSRRYFKCEPFRGIFLPINKLIPVRRPNKAEDGTEVVPQPTILDIGVIVEAETFLTDSPHQKTWIKGTIVHIVLLEVKALIAVELVRYLW